MELVAPGLDRRVAEARLIDVESADGAFRSAAVFAAVANKPLAIGGKLIPRPGHPLDDLPHAVIVRSFRQIAGLSRLLTIVGRRFHGRC